MNTTISLCMIVKNEAHNLTECLRSVQGVIDEAIVVDTGSEDGTEAIARRFGARVVRFPWHNDFAAARNAGLEHATSGWILILDADERLDPAHKMKLRACAQLEQFDGFYLQIHNHFDNGSEGINPLIRMFKNCREHRFVGRLHEQVVSSIYRHNPAASFPLTDIKIHHYGYMHEVVKEKDKNRRNITILEQMLVETPGDPFTLFNIGVEYMQLPDLDKALNAFREARSKVDPNMTSYAGLLFKNEIKCLQLLGRMDEAIRACDEAIEIFPQYTDLFQLKGFCLMNAGKLEEAKTAIFRAYELGPPPPGYHTEQGIGTYQTCYMLGLLHELLRKYTLALEWYMAAIKHNPNVLPPVYRILRVSKCIGNTAWIGHFVKNRLKNASDEETLKMINILLDADQIGFALKLAHRLKSATIKSDKSVMIMKGQLLSGELKKARTTIRQVKSKERETFDALMNWLEKRDAKSMEELPFQPEHIPLAAMAAYRIGQAADALRLIENRLKSEESVAAYKKIVRSLSGFADNHLEPLTSSPSATNYRELVQNIRLALPYEDGF